MAKGLFITFYDEDGKFEVLAYEKDEKVFYKTKSVTGFEDLTHKTIDELKERMIKHSVQFEEVEAECEKLNKKEKEEE